MHVGALAVSFRQIGKALYVERYVRWCKRKEKFPSSWLSCKTIFVIQSLKTFGKEAVTQTLIDMLTAKLTDAEKSVVLKGAAEAIDWVYDTISRKICGGEQTQ